MACVGVIQVQVMVEPYLFFRQSLADDLIGSGVKRARHDVKNKKTLGEPTLIAGI